MTLYVFRLLSIVPAAQAADLNAWLVANMGESAGTTFGVGLSADGSPPATHYVCCWGMAVAELLAMMTPLCAAAGVAIPDGWASWAAAEQRDWVIEQAPAVAAATGVRVLAVDLNEGTWSDYNAAVAAAGLSPIRTDG